MALRVPHLLCPAVLLTTVLSACSGPLSEGRSEFDKGHYAAARHVLTSMDHPGKWGVPERAEYALYRGLSCGALEDAYPGSLPAEDDHRLRAALQTYEMDP